MGKSLYPKINDTVKAKQFIQDNVIPLLLKEDKIPRSDHIKGFLRIAKLSTPGPDGIPYAAWKAVGEMGTDALYKALLIMMKQHETLG